MHTFLLGYRLFLFPVRTYPLPLLPEEHVNLIYSTSETKQKTLEEIASAFGDRVILPDERSKDGDRDEDGDGKTDPQHVEAVYVRQSG